MKRIIYLVVIHLSLLCGGVIAQAQQKKTIWPDAVKITDIYLITDTLHKFYDLNNKTMSHILGKPLKTKRQYDEINEKFYKNYIFKNGEVNFVDDMPYMDIKSRGWGIQFKTKKGFTPIFRVGDNILPMKRYFPNSWAGHDDHGIGLGLATPNGKLADAYITLFTKNGRITDIIISEDDS